MAWSSAANQYLVVWDDGRSEPIRGTDIVGRKVSATGIPAGPAIRISGAGATSDDEYPALAWSESAGQYLVVWNDWRNKPTRGSDISGRRVKG